MGKKKRIKIKVSDDIINYCRLTGKKPKEAVNEAIERGVSEYKTDYKNGPKKAVYMPKELPGFNPEPIECWILGKTDIFGNPYYRAVVDGRIAKLPAGQVTFKEV